MWIPILSLILLKVHGAASLQEPEICYILDGILFLYGIVLTALYCHLKIKTKREQKKTETAVYEKVGGERIYTGLGPVEKGQYETLRSDPKKN
ncbi:high affinity immunoglobulin epsilon receptor subunit gamma [Rhinophrynus dorsalis]